MQVAVSKGEFAHIIGVSPGRVSQYLTEGKITSGALVGTGRNARINVEQAKADLRLTLDVSQRLGNGIETRLDAPQQFVSPAQAVLSETAQQGADYQIKQQKLEQLRRANRNGAKAEALDRGQLIETEAARVEMMKISSSMLQIFEGGLTDLSSAIASQFKLPQRDILHLLRQQFRLIRATAAKQMELQAASLTETVETELAAEDIEGMSLS